MHIPPLRRIVLCLLVIAGFVTSAYAADVKIYGDDNYQPVIFRDADGKPKGVLVDVLNQVQRTTGIPINLELLPWKRAYVSAERGFGGVIGLSKNAARLAIFDYSDPIYEDSIMVVVLKGKEFPFTKLEDLKGKLIGTQLGASFGTDVDAAIAAGTITVDNENNHIARMKKLLIGRIDAAFIGNGKAGLDGLIQSDPELRDNKAKFAVLPMPLTRDELYLGFKKSMNMTSYLAEFNHALADAKARKLIPALVPAGKN